MFAELSAELFIILSLILLNGFFSGSEIAVVSARRSRLQAEADSGSKAAHKALQLTENPDRFLATVQVGITLIGTFSAAFGGAHIGDILAAWMKTVPALEPYAETLALLLVVVVITYLSLVLGELVPKRLGLQNAERLALIAAPVMTRLSHIAAPIVSFLTLSVNLVLRLLGQADSVEDTVTEEDIVYMVGEGTESGSVEAGEARFIRRVFQFTDRPVRAMMTPRPQIAAVRVDMSLAEINAVFLESKFSRLPVYEDTIDHIIGTLYIKDMLPIFAEKQEEPDIQSLIRPPVFVPETIPGDEILLQFRQQGTHIALVIGEYGQVVGLVTLEDLLEELVGEIWDEYDDDQTLPFIQRDDGSWLIDALEPYDRVCQVIGLQDDDAESNSLAGVILSGLERIPTEGDTFTVQDFVFEVMDMDGVRIDKVLAYRKPESDSASSADLLD